MSPSTALRDRLKQTLIWAIDHAGPAASRLGRREAAVAARVALERTMHRVHPAHRRMRADRLAAIRELKSATASLSAAPEAAPRVEVPVVAGARIGVFIPGFLSGFGGAEKVAGQVASLLDRSGARVDLICIAPPRAVRPYRLEGAVEMQVLEGFATVERLRSRNYDLLVSFGMPGFYRRIPAVAEALGVPFVIQECTNPTAMQQALGTSFSLETEQEAHWVRQAVLAHAAGARFTTPAYAQTAHADAAAFAYGFYNAFSRPASSASRTAPARQLICVGALKNRNKNGLAAAESFDAFATRNAGWSMHFFGDNNFADLFGHWQRRHARGVIVDAGTERDMERIYGAAWGLVIPSFTEGLPNVVVEAFTFGVPCIGFSDCDGVRHLIEDGVTGLLVDRQKPGALAEAMERLADPDLRARLSGNAAAFAVANLSLPVWEANWLRLVGNALARLDNSGQARMPIGASDGIRPEAWRRLLASFPVTG